jgi:hypothetical protein
LEKEGYFVTRASASKGLFDLIAVKKEDFLSANPYAFCLGIEFLQLKKNITEKKSINLLRKIEKQILGTNIMEIASIASDNTGKKSFGFLGESFSMTKKKKILINIRFGIIYTLPKKKKK